MALRDLYWMNHQKEVCMDTLQIIMIHPFLCILSPCHTVKASPHKIMPQRKREKQRQRKTPKQREHRRRCRDKEKMGTTGNNTGKKVREKKTKRNRTYLKLSFLCTVTYISYSLPWGTAPAGTNKLTPAGGSTAEEGWVGVEMMSFFKGFINFLMHNWIIECTTYHHFIIMINYWITICKGNLCKNLVIKISSEFCCSVL